MANRRPESQTNVEMYADAIDAIFGADFHIPERFHSQLMAATFGMDGSADAALLARGSHPVLRHQPDLERQRR